MRRIVFISCVFAFAALAHAGAGDKKGSGGESAEDRRTLSAAAVAKYLTPYTDSIGACYKKHGLVHKKATGDLRLELIIHRNGSVFRVEVWAPGVKGKALERCIQKLSKKWSFPQRRGFTHVLVPFFYLRTEAKGAGPTITCWSARGCPKKRRAQRARVRGNDKGSDAGKGKGAKKGDKASKGKGANKAGKGKGANKAGKGKGGKKDAADKNKGKDAKKGKNK